MYQSQIHLSDQTWASDVNLSCLWFFSFLSLYFLYFICCFFNFFYYDDLFSFEALPMNYSLIKSHLHWQCLLAPNYDLHLKSHQALIHLQQSCYLDDLIRHRIVLQAQNQLVYSLKFVVISYAHHSYYSLQEHSFTSYLILAQDSALQYHL